MTNSLTCPITCLIYGTIWLPSPKPSPEFRCLAKWGHSANGGDLRRTGGDKLTSPRPQVPSGQVKRGQATHRSQYRQREPKNLRGKIIKLRKILKLGEKCWRNYYFELHVCVRVCVCVYVRRRVYSSVASRVCTLVLKVWRKNPHRATLKEGREGRKGRKRRKKKEERKIQNTTATQNSFHICNTSSATLHRRRSMCVYVRVRVSVRVRIAHSLTHT